MSRKGVPGKGNSRGIEARNDGTCMPKACDGSINVPLIIYIILLIS